jgi:phi13 family phage major tail protein
MANKIKHGLANVYYAKEIDTAGVITYATPVAIPGAVNISLSPTGEITPLYADNTEYYTAIANNGYDGNLEIALIPDAFRTDVLGEALSTTDKVLTESSNVQPSKFALMFQFEGDAKAIRHVLYSCKAARPNIESSTKQNNIEAKTETLALTVRPRADGIVKRRTTETTTDTVYNGWFTAVYNGESAG